MFCLFCSFWSMNLGCSVSVIIWFHILSEIHNSSLTPGAVFSFKVKSIWHSVPCLVALATLTYSYDFINFYVDLHCKHFFIQTFFFLLGIHSPNIFKLAISSSLFQTQLVHLKCSGLCASHWHHKILIYVFPGLITVPETT